MTPGAGRLARVVVGGAVLLGVVAWAGPAAFVEGVAALDPTSLALAALLTAVAVLACGWRWHLVARGLGVAITPGAAVLGCYCAQAVNLTVPGGVVGDVHRGIRHGRVTGQTSLALRSVAWERVAGQVVQVGVLLAVLLLLPDVLPGPDPVLVTILVLAAALALGLSITAGRRGSGARLVHAVGEDLRRGVASREVWPGLLLTSLGAVAAHLATFVVAARAVGVTASWSVLLPVSVVVLTAAALPVNVAGWGPREGVAAWAFGAADLGIAAGAATATAYGCLVLATHLPGLVLLLVPERGRADRVLVERGSGHG